MDVISGHMEIDNPFISSHCWYCLVRGACMVGVSVDKILLLTGKSLQKGVALVEFPQYVWFAVGASFW